MKPSFRRILAVGHPLQYVSLVAAACFTMAMSAEAQKTWTGGTDAIWATATNWLEGSAPLGTETAVFDANSTANLAISLNANAAARGITLSSPSGPVSISGTSTLTLGFGGIDLSASTQNLTLSTPVTLADQGKQTWPVATGRTLTLGATPGKATGSACPLQVSTSGTTVFGSATTNLIIDGPGNPYVTLGQNDWAGLSTGTVVASTYTNATTALVAGVVNDIKANLTGANGTDVSAIRFNETTSYDLTVSNSGTARTMTARGILVTANSAGGSIGGNLRNNGFVRPNRTSGVTSFNIIQNSASDFTIGANLSNASSNVPVRIVKSGTGKLILLQDNGHTGGTYIDAGTVQFGNNSPVSGFAGFGFPGSGDIVNHGSLVFNLASEKTLIHNISGTGSFNQTGSGTLNLTTSLSTFTGPVNVTGGTLGVTSMANLGSGTDINLNGGALKFLGVFDPTVRNVIIGSSGATLNTNGNAITLLSPFVSGSTGALVKSGAGTLSIEADNDYSGGTTVSVGTLLASNSSGSATGSGAVSVSSGATLGGTGTIAGPVTIQSGGIVSPGSGVGTLNLASLTLSTGSTGVFEFDASPANDAVNVTNSGGLTVDGGALTLLVAGTSTPFATPGTYNLINYSGSIAGSGVTSLSVANPQPGFSYVFNAAGGVVTLTIATTGVVSEWGNVSGGSWATSGNWTNATVPDAVGATANFFSAITSPSQVTLDGGKTVGAVAFNNGLQSYTIAQGTSGSLTFDNGSNASSIANNDGNHDISAPVTIGSDLTLFTASADDSTSLSGVISGPVGDDLVKNGPGGLSLLGDNLFQGDVSLNGGTTTFANGGLGLGDLSVTDSTLVWSTGNTQDISDRAVTFGPGSVTFDTNGNDVSFANAIGGASSSAFVKTGSGALSFATSPDFTGAVTVAAGTLQLGTGASSGLVSGSINNQSAVVVNLADGLDVPNLISGTGSFTHGGSGSLSLSAANTFSGTTLIPASAATLLLGNPLAIQNSTLDLPTAGGSLSFGIQTAATLGGLSGSKSIALENTTPAAVALTVGGNNSDTSYTGVFSGSGSLTKAGTGIFTLSGIHTYTGATTVAAGTLSLDAPGAISTTSANVNGGKLSINGGTLTASATSTIVSGGAAGGLHVLSGGSATMAAVQSGANDGALISVEDGTFSASSITLTRTASFNNLADPSGPASDVSGFVVTGGTASVSGALNIGTSNSGASALVNGGSLTVGGQVTVGNNSATSRWNIFEVRSGTFVSSDATNGVILSVNASSLNRAQFLVSGSGVATVEKVSFGTATSATGSVGRLSLTGGTLYVGSGGLVQNAPAGTYTSQIQCSSGTLGANADWSTNLPISLIGTGTVRISAKNQDEDPFNITLNGPITGSGSNSIEKDGAGTVTFGGGNSYPGNTTVLAGVLKVQTKTFADDALVSVDLAAGAALNLDFSGGDKVGTFLIDGSMQPDGIYGSLTNTTPGITQTAAITGTGLLYVNVDPPSSAFASWASANGLTAGVNDGPTQDPDNDGIENLLEFVLGGLPLTPSSGILPTLNASGSNFVFTFNRSDESEAEVTLTFQHGTDLAAWTDVSIGATDSLPTVAVAENGASADVITVTVPKGTNTKLFGRLQGTK